MQIFLFIIIIGVACLIANGAYFSILKGVPPQQAASEITPEKRLRRAYKAAYFTHVSLSDEAKNENGGSADAY